MTIRSSVRGLVAASGVLVVLGLAVPPALATPGDGRGAGQQNAPTDPGQGNGPEAAPGQNRAASPTATPAPAQAAGQGPAQAAAAGQNANAKPTKEPKTDKTPGGGNTKAPGQSNGNSGTIKVAAPGEGTHPDNNPKPGCLLRLDFYGFNTGTYDVRINAHPPTGNGELLVSDTVTITQPRKGADGHYQMSRTYDLRPALANIEPARQGYHVKITVSNPTKPGNGGKHKVAWLDCPPPAPAVAPTVNTPTVTTPGTGGGGTTTTPQVRGTRTTRPAAVVVRRPTVAPAGARVLGVRLTGTLPRTGVSADRMLWVALAVVQWGLILMVGARLASPKESLATA